LWFLLGVEFDDNNLWQLYFATLIFASLWMKIVIVFPLELVVISKVVLENILPLADTP